MILASSGSMRDSLLEKPGTKLTADVASRHPSQ
jgi:hypothetical protein